MNKKQSSNFASEFTSLNSNSESSTLDKLRSFKVTPLNIALFDLSLALFGTALLFVLVGFSYNKISHNTEKANYWILFFLGFFLAIPIGIVVHKIFGINTALNHALGISGPPKK
jgi:hypothetical protein